MSESPFNAVAVYYGNDTLAMLAKAASAGHTRVSYVDGAIACPAVLSPAWACGCGVAVAVAAVFAWAGLREWQVRAARRARRRARRERHSGKSDRSARIYWSGATA